MKKVAKWLVDSTLLPVVAHISRQTATLPKRVTVMDGVVQETMRRAIANSADYADKMMPRALSLDDNNLVRRHAFAARNARGMIVEFGVWTGNSARLFASLTEETIYGFDSFEGLRENWTGSGGMKGTFDLNGVPPRMPANVKLVKGWFDETLPAFLREHPEPFSFVHIDCDTYEATSIVLREAGDRIVPGTVIVLDEYFGYRGWRLGEYRAWQEFVTARGLAYEYLAFSDLAVSLVVTLV